MATNEVDFSVRVYTTPVPIDNPGAEINYKGLICVNKNFSSYPGSTETQGGQHIPDGTAKDKMRAELIEKAKNKAAELSANAIVCMRIDTIVNVIGSNLTIEMVLYGTAVYYIRAKDE